MSSRLARIVARKEALVARSQTQRAELNAIAERLRGEMTLVDTAYGAARTLSRIAPVVGAAALAMFTANPSGASGLISKVARFGPLVLGAYRLFRRHKDRTDDD